MEVKRLPLGDFTVNTGDQIDGYGYKHLDDFINNLRFMTGDRPVKKAMEWCSGPGYIGLGLIAINYAQTVLLSDIHPPVEDIVNLTIKENNLSTGVSFVVSDNFKNINDKFDLIVGNPPHFNFTYETVNTHYIMKNIESIWMLIGRSIKTFLKMLQII